MKTTKLWPRLSSQQLPHNEAIAVTVVQVIASWFVCTALSKNFFELITEGICCEGLRQAAPLIALH